jgi:hypothetical protein
MSFGPMSFDARPPMPSGDSPIVRRPVGTIRTAVSFTYGRPAGGTAAALADTVLRTALREFASTAQRTGHDPQEIDRWENEGGSPGRPASRAPDARVVGGRERRAWAAHDVAHDAVAAAVRAYTRVLRGDGVTLAAALIAVAASVRGHAASHPSREARDAAERDAARSCLEAYYGP